MPNSLKIQLVNRTTSQNVFAFITGLAMQHGMARVFIKADGKGLYYPEAPSAGKILQPLTEDCAIPLGAPGNTVNVTIPQMAGGRIWFSAEKKLTFLRNPGGPGGGAALVEPSVLNPSDPNADVDFTFCEFTLNNDQLFANISYVDFVSRLPIALTLQTKGGAVQHVSGMPSDGLDKVCAGLKAQSAKDGRPWEKLIIQPKGQDRPLRALNPTHCNAIGANFDGYFEPLRGCICDVHEHPSGPETFYRCDPTNHYSRIVHECNLDGKGYAFAYDDVQPDGGGSEWEGERGDPEVFVVEVGGGGVCG
ncbi:hypothetical protein N0V88_002096 [Collariella sp. IMI 366227]|nr:hypothetical protein N0V88_002096 [Collariella sp. IMI 366227]